MTPRREMLDAALAYTRRGWSPVPCCWPAPWPPPPGGAQRCGVQWHNHRTPRDIGKATLVAWEYRQAGPPVSELEVRVWWERWVCAANVALLLQPSRLVVVDCDSDAAIAEAEALGLPAGAAIATSGKGQHHYFALPAEAAHLAGRRTTKRGESHTLDVLAGGIVIAPPSRHASGRRYEWLIPPGEAPLPPAPAWALEMLEKASEPQAAQAADLPDNLPAVDVETLPVPARIKALIRQGLAADAEGRYPSRSEAVFAVAEAMVRAGLDDAAIAAVLLNPACAISEKPRERGRRWLAREIARARAKAGPLGVPIPTATQADYDLARQTIAALPEHHRSLLSSPALSRWRHRVAALADITETGLVPCPVIWLLALAAVGGDERRAVREYRRAAAIAERNQAAAGTVG